MWGQGSAFGVRTGDTQGQQREEPGNSPPRSPCRPAGTVPRQPPIRVPRPPFERRAPALWVCGRAFPRTVARTRRRALGGSTGGSSGHVPGEGRLSALNPATLRPELRGDRRLSAASQCLRGEGRRGPRGDRHQPGWGRGRSSGALSWASGQGGRGSRPGPGSPAMVPSGSPELLQLPWSPPRPQTRTHTQPARLAGHPPPASPGAGRFWQSPPGCCWEGCREGFPPPCHSLVTVVTKGHCWRPQPPAGLYGCRGLSQAPRSAHWVPGWLPVVSRRGLALCKRRRQRPGPGGTAPGSGRIPAL